MKVGLSVARTASTYTCVSLMNLKDYQRNVVVNDVSGFWHTAWI
jgi:hypothetical protein